MPNIDTFILAQILSAIAALIFIASVQFKNKRHIIFFIMADTLIVMAALALMGAWGGFMTNLCSLLPSIYVYKTTKRFKKPNPNMVYIFWGILFMAWLSVASQPVDILALMGTSLYTFSLFQKKENNVRGMLILNQFSWVSYNLFVGLFPAAFFGLCFIISDSIAIIRYRKRGRTHKAVEHWWK